MSLQVDPAGDQPVKLSGAKQPLVAPEAPAELDADDAHAVIRVRVGVMVRYSHRKKRLARKANSTAYPVSTSSGAAGGNGPRIESWIASTAAPSGM
jgi:hypothetical protein